MKNEEIAVFTKRITSANRTELISILYDIYFAYTEDALQELQATPDGENAVSDTALKDLRMAGQVLEHLKADLNFKYEISANLYALYDYAERMLSKTIFSGKAESLLEANRIMKPLQESFREVAKTDHSAPLMQNTEKVAAGYTYGRHDVNEYAMNFDNNRGFLA